ncbi:hypothetical protein GF406_13140, partial [candidate division KSB1 bacterium]|nr:hypothetical protein [candidate division KSB1 bacterium]
PMDYLYASYRHRWFTYSWFAANLDPTRFAIDGEPGYQRRYLAAHRLEVKPLPRLRIAVSEAIIFGGPEFSSHFAFFNPVTLYHSVQNNGPEGGNTIGTLSALWMPFHTLSLYGSVMIDDIQVEYSVPGDMEPDEIGWMLGTIWADPGPVSGLDLYAEYSRITNRTYNTPSPWEKWLHRREPVGHFLGNDFDRLLVGADYWPRLSWRAGLQYEHRRRGEGRIENEFDTPWLDYTLEQGYSEPFPTGIVETSDILSASLTWQPRWWGRLFMQASHWSVANADHITGNSDSYWTMQAGVQIDWGAKWQLP